MGSKLLGDGFRIESINYSEVKPSSGSESISEIKVSTSKSLATEPFKAQLISTDFFES